MLSPKEGGRWDAANGGGDTPFEIVRAYLKNGRCEFKDKQIIFKNSYGNIEYGADGNPIGDKLRKSANGQGGRQKKVK